MVFCVLIVLFYPPSPRAQAARHASTPLPDTNQQEQERPQNWFPLVQFISATTSYIMNQTNSTLADLRDSLMSHGQSVLDDLSDAATLAKDWTSAHPAISGIVGAGLILGALYGAK